jgi:hypothetical protein
VLVLVQLAALVAQEQRFQFQVHPLLMAVAVEVGVEQLLELQVMVAALLQVVLEVLTEQQEQQIRAVAVEVLLTVVLVALVDQELLLLVIQAQYKKQLAEQ